MVNPALYWTTLAGLRWLACGRFSAIDVASQFCTHFPDNILDDTTGDRFQYRRAAIDMRALNSKALGCP